MYNVIKFILFETQFLKQIQFGNPKDSFHNIIQKSTDKNGKFFACGSCIVSVDWTWRLFFGTQQSFGQTRSTNRCFPTSPSFHTPVSIINSIHFIFQFISTLQHSCSFCHLIFVREISVFESRKTFFFLLSFAMNEMDWMDWEIMI